MRKRKPKARKRKPPALKKGWLTVCPNCGYLPKGLQKAHEPHLYCPVCFYRGPAIQVRAADYSHREFEHQRIPEKHEGAMVWPEIMMILLLSAIAAVLLWMAARGAF